MAVIKCEASRISEKFPVPGNGVRYRIGTHKIKGERRPDTVAMSVDTPPSDPHCSNTARQASLRLAFCRRRQEVMARTFGISPAHRR